MLDFEVLRLVWWLLFGFLACCFLLFDGVDQGVSMALPFVGRVDSERRMILHTMGRLTEGSQLWFILCIGAILAAWPLVFRAAFPGLYLAMVAVALALALRPVLMALRRRAAPDATWRQGIDGLIALAGFVPPLLCGIAVGNVLRGLPFSIGTDFKPHYFGKYGLELLGPFPLLCGLLAVNMSLMHGAAFLVARAEGMVAERARLLGAWSALAVVALFGIGGLFIAFLLHGYVLAGGSPLAPMSKDVLHVVRGWLFNYDARPWVALAPFLGFQGAAMALFALNGGGSAGRWAWLFSALSIIGIIGTVGASMYPFILPSAADPRISLTLWDATVPAFTLQVMLGLAGVMVVLALAYTLWVFRVARTRVTLEQVDGR